MSAAQLSIRSYFDPDIFAAETERFFSPSSLTYAGHAALVPNENDFCVLPHTADAMILNRKNGQLQVTANICRHRQAFMLQGRGNARHLACPLHKWTYDWQGKLIAAPRFEETPCQHLENHPTRDWHGLQFYGNTEPLRHLDTLPARFVEQMRFDGYGLGELQVQTCEYNWKTFIEVYLEDYHVQPFHPGLGQFVSTAAIDWAFGENWSTQTVGFYRNLEKPGDSEIYRRWHQAALDYYGGKLPEVAVMWFMLYPNIMIEVYPAVTIISSIIPDGIERCTNIIEYYHPQELLDTAQGRELCELARAAYFETAEEDNIIGEQMQKGRTALYKARRNEIGPYQRPLEDGMEHFHLWYRRQMQGINVD